MNNSRIDVPLPHIPLCKRGIEGDLNLHGYDPQHKSPLPPFCKGGHTDYLRMALVQAGVST